MNSPSSSITRGADDRSKWRPSLVTKTLVVFVTVAMLPAASVSGWLTGLYRGAIETTERQRQTSVLAEVSTLVLRRIDDARSDAEALATALSFAAKQPEALASASSTVKALLATRRSLRAVRFEVPDAAISTVFRMSDVAGNEVPLSTQTMRALADERGLSFTVASANLAVLVVPIPRAQVDGPRGYVTAAIDLAPLAEELRTISETRFDRGDVHLLIADEQRRAVASFGNRELELGASTAALAIWRVLPLGIPWERPVSVVTEHPSPQGEMVGGVQTLPSLAWAVAVWRPKSAAYASLSELTPRFTATAIASLVLALLVGAIAARSISGPVVRLNRQARRIGERKWNQLDLPENRKDEIGALSRSMFEMAQSLERSEAEIRREVQLRADLSRFMSHELVEAIVRGEHGLALGGSRAEITVLFADVVAFTPMAESRAPEEVVALLNELFSMLSEIVFRHAGTVDKFIGDCIMAVWGAPTPQSDHALRALRAADEMMRFLEVGNEDWRERLGVELRLAIGINSGTVIVGNVGSKKRMEYTAIGDVVNVAARLETLARPNQVLLAEPTQLLAAGEFQFRSCGTQQLSGRTKSIGVYELCTE